MGFIPMEGQMKVEKFNLEAWRSVQSISKLEAARRIGIGKNSYLKYEAEGMCPRYVRLSAVALGMGVR
jgi:DNA-binding XRE family transcriptional regulator